jgi:hypothetical protein
VSPVNPGNGHLSNQGVEYNVRGMRSVVLKAFGEDGQEFLRALARHCAIPVIVLRQAEELNSSNSLLAIQ